MSKKHRTEGGIIYSTNPNQALNIPGEENLDEARPLKQDLRVSLDKKQRAGKSVTVVSGFQGNPQHLESLAKLLKSKLGVGGAAKDGLILIQGDFRDKIIVILTAEGYKAKKAGA